MSKKIELELGVEKVLAEERKAMSESIKQVILNIVEHLKQSKAKQSKAKQSKAKQSKAKQSKAKQLCDCVTQLEEQQRKNEINLFQLISSHGIGDKFSPHIQANFQDHKTFKFKVHEEKWERRFYLPVVKYFPHEIKYIYYGEKTTAKLLLAGNQHRYRAPMTAWIGLMSQDYWLSHRQVKEV